jgi:SAM-dependent methyltransferase
MFYAKVISAVCILVICMRYRRFKWLKEIKLAVEASTANRCQVLMNKRLKDRKQKLLYDGLKRLHDRLRENETHQHQQPDSSDANRRLNIVEIGAGAGANFEFYPPGVTVTCVEPNAKFEAHIRRNAERCPDVRVDKFHVAFAEDMTQCIESGSADAVVCTLVLCSVRNVEQCLSEVIRILKPVMI